MPDQVRHDAGVGLAVALYTAEPDTGVNPVSSKLGVAEPGRAGGCAKAHRRGRGRACRYAYSFSVNSGTTLNRSPTRPTSAIWKIGASSSLLIAMMTLESFIPARCWIAPEMPTAT